MKAAHTLDRLDFLLIIEAVLAHKTITRAAEHLGTSQSALSHALVRLRQRFNDPLFVRTGNVMQPTPLVASFTQPLETSLALIRNEILGAARFDPATSQRVFRICVSEIGAVLLVPRLLRLLQQRAPHAALRPMPVPIAEIPAALESGAIDLALGPYDSLRTTLFQQQLLTRSYQAIVRAGHPTIGNRMTLRQLHATPQVRCSTGTKINEWFDDHFAKEGLTPPPIALETPYIMAVGNIVGASDWIALVSQDLVQTMQAMAPLRVVELPFSLPKFTVRQYWHRRFKNDDANRFLRTLVYDALHE